MLTDVLLRQAPLAAGPERPSRGERWFAELRRREFARLDEQAHAYLDYTGSGLYAERQLREHALLLRDAVLGNPHADSPASRASTALAEEARAHVLRFFGADADEWAVIFTPNASGALRLVGESFPFGREAPLVLSADNHNSVNGIREHARAAGAPVHYLSLDAALRLADPVAELRAVRGTGLVAFPAQSNFSGVRHPLSLVGEARARGHRVLLDAAAYVPTSALRLRALGDDVPDFVALSFYKIFGYPTGVGALLARHDALAELRRPWFAGGTVDWVSVQGDAHRLRAGGEAFEDGTIDFLSLGALRSGFALLDEVGYESLQRHVGGLLARLLDGLASLRHADGAPMVETSGPGGRDALVARGATVALNLRDARGGVVPYELVEARARDARVSLRGGCFCNPGASERALSLPPARTAACLALLGDRFSPAALRECLGGAPVGAVRLSLGMASNAADVDRALAVLEAVGRGG